MAMFILLALALLIGQISGGYGGGGYEEDYGYEYEGDGGYEYEEDGGYEYEGDDYWTIRRITRTTRGWWLRR